MANKKTDNINETNVKAETAEPTASYDMRLSWKNTEGNIVQEYIPPFITRQKAWALNKYVAYLIKNGKDIYYWNLRHQYDSNLRKQYDIAFIMHCIEDHDAKPTDPKELKWFNRLWQQYAVELTFMGREIVKDPMLSWETEKLFNGDPYAYAYNLKWLNPLGIIAQSKTFYHGLSYGDYLSLREQELVKVQDQLNAQVKQRNANIKKLIKKQTEETAINISEAANEPEPQTKTPTGWSTWQWLLLWSGTNAIVVFVVVAMMYSYYPQTLKLSDAWLMGLVTFASIEILILFCFVLYIIFTWLETKIRKLLKI